MTVKDPAFIAEAERLKLEPELVTTGEIEQILRGIYAASPAIIARARAALQNP